MQSVFHLLPVIILFCSLISLPGAVGTTWFVFWLFLGFDSPATHPRISPEEKKYIESSIEEDSVIHASNDKVQ